MRNITYYVATSLDGYISGPQGDISGFIQKGDGINQYLQDLRSYDTVIMGRKTYEFGYAFGLQPGQPAYPHMQHYIFSDNLKFDAPHEQVKVCPLDLKVVQELKEGGGPDIYLCGGGVFAGWLLDNELIDVLKIKLNPLVLGQGVRLFGDSKETCSLTVTGQQQYEKGLQILTYRIDYPKKAGV